MSWQIGLILTCSGFSLFGGIACMVEASQRRKLSRTLRRLNSPYFRNVYDGYYRVGNISGVGR